MNFGEVPVKYTDPDGKFTWIPAEEECNVHYNSLYDPALVNCRSVFSTDIIHSRTSETGNLNNHSYTVSLTQEKE